nr:unnamed protein product [Digitaria exilis]
MWRTSSSCIIQGKKKHHAAHLHRCPWSRRAPEVPIINNAFTFFVLLRHNPHRALARLAKTYGPIFL